MILFGYNRNNVYLCSGEEAGYRHGGGSTREVYIQKKR